MFDADIPPRQDPRGFVGDDRLLHVRAADKKLTFELTI
jgi:hypothetical protein